VTPLSPQSFAVQFTASRSGHDKLRYAQELLGHQVLPGDIAQIYELALDALIPQLERSKFAATTRPRTGRHRGTAATRHVPAHVRRAVWERDGGQCTFVSDAGCSARRGLQVDHIQEVARGGGATVAGIRLLCRAHNQYTAECTFGAEFMRHKRIAAAEARAEARRARQTEALPLGGRQRRPQRRLAAGPRTKRRGSSEA
jgi:5-methylcytosine-specific restriction endonuclease McrA